MDPSSFSQTLATNFQQGGLWMVPIAIALTISVAFTLERFVRLFMQYPVNGASFMFEVQKFILANDLDGAIRICNGAGQAALPKVIKAGLQRASRPDEQIQNAIDAASLETIPKLERRDPAGRLLRGAEPTFDAFEYTWFTNRLHSDSEA